MKPITGTRQHPRETQPLNAQPARTQFIALYGDDLDDGQKPLIDKLLHGRSLQARFIDASALNARQAVMQATAELPKNGHLLICAHGQNATNNNRETHYIGLPHGALPCIATEALVKMVVDQLGITPSRVDQPGKGLPFIYFLSCHSGALRRQINPQSNLWKRANLLMFAGSGTTDMFSTKNLMAGAIAYIEHCQKNMREVDPLKLFFFAGMHRGDCITLMGGKLSAPLVWHAPKSGADQGRIDNVSGSPEDKQRFEQAVASLRPEEYRLLPAASLMEVMCNRIARDDADHLRELLSAHPERRDAPLLGTYYSPLGYAAEYLSSRCLLALLEAGADPNAPDSHGDRALMEAVRFSICQTGNVKTLLDHGADPNLCNVNGWTALMFACRKGHQDAVELLLAHGANPALQNNVGVTALALACDNGHAGVVRALLAHGVDPNLRNTQQRTVLIKACIDGHTAVVKELLFRGAKLDVQDKDGMTALMWSVGHTHLSATEFLLARGADPDIQDRGGTTALMYAAAMGEAKAVQTLLAFDADPDLQNNSGETALALACQKGDTAVMRRLLNNNANPDLQNNQGVTALMEAVGQPGTAAVELLLEHGARTDLFASDGSSCLIRAARQNRADVLRLLFSFGAGPAAGLNQQLMDEASALGHHEAAQMLKVALEHYNSLQ